MRRILLFLFISLCLVSSGQVPIKTDTTFLTADSVAAEIRRRQDSLNEAYQKEEAARFVENNSKNLDYFVRLQKEQQAKQKRNAIVRISIGVVLLIVLFIGLRRRSKK